VRTIGLDNIAVEDWPTWECPEITAVNCVLQNYKD